MQAWLIKWLGRCLIAGGGGALLIAIGAAYGLWHYGSNLPDHKFLADYQPQVTSRVYAGDGRLIAEYALEKRVFVPLEAIPPILKGAFIAAEDKRFFSHYGLDGIAIMRALVNNVSNIAHGRKLIGASTITQQVAKNFLLTNTVSFERKIREAIIALRLERALDKERILELYLNEIYLGQGSYGVAAAALAYFDKPMHELSVAEAAYLAALPKAPNNYHPVRQKRRALQRRNWVIDRMLQEGQINPEQAEEARRAPLEIARSFRGQDRYQADYFVEDVRKQLVRRLGSDRLYTDGLSIQTTLDPRLQSLAQRALEQGLEAYDRRHSYRGPLGRVDLSAPRWLERLRQQPPPKGKPTAWQQAVVLDSNPARLLLLPNTPSEEPQDVTTEALRWGKKAVPFKPGDVILVTHDQGTITLRQIPTVNGAIVAMDPHTGRVLAMVGGWSFDSSEFNRATQAQRQPGSAFKPFVYLAGLEHGRTPATFILDAPFILDQGPGRPKWRPANFSRKFYGPQLMREGLVKSRNLMTARLANDIGMPAIQEVARRFNIQKAMPAYLSMALGAGETTLLNITNAYASFVNGGHQIVPTLIDKIQTRHGRTIFQHATTHCPASCNIPRYLRTPPPSLPEDRAILTNPIHAYQIVTMLSEVTTRGTARSLRTLSWPLAGKTGTTNDTRDSWFVGFSANLIVGVYAGFDIPFSLGSQETGSSIALPIFRLFMERALEGQNPTPFRIPNQAAVVWIDRDSGRPRPPQAPNAVAEAFMPGQVPDPQHEQVLIGEPSQAEPSDTIGLY